MAYITTTREGDYIAQWENVGIPDDFNGSKPHTIPLLERALPLIPLLLVCLALLPKAQAVSPAPEGHYPGCNTAEGQNAPLSLTSADENPADSLPGCRIKTPSWKHGSRVSQDGIP
jgi:hypothetical protein